MSHYRVTAIPQEITNKVRATLSSPQYGHPAHVELASGYGPCRSCLRTFHEGEENRILFTYNPFAERDMLPSPGPVFIHEHDCQRYDDAALPAQFHSLPLFLEGYGRAGVILERERVEDQPLEPVIDRFFLNPALRFINVRNAEAGCFIAQIDHVEVR
jgi:hypothetical protein